MASQGGDAGAQAPAQFIGALISLIAKSEIRYQGILAQIDPAAATISLEEGELSPRSPFAQLDSLLIIFSSLHLAMQSEASARKDGKRRRGLGG